MYVVKYFVRRADGTKRYYYVLRANLWDKRERRPVQRYLAYLGRSPAISLERARAIAKKLGITLEELKRARGLKIVE